MPSSVTHSYGVTSAGIVAVFLLLNNLGQFNPKRAVDQIGAFIFICKMFLRVGVPKQVILVKSPRYFHARVVRG